MKNHMEHMYYNMENWDFIWKTLIPFSRKLFGIYGKQWKTHGEIAAQGFPRENALNLRVAIENDHRNSGFSHEK